MRALLCDLDGTLIDSREDLASAVHLLFADLGLPRLPLERVVANVGRGARALVRRCLEDAGAEIAQDDPRLAGFLPHYESVLLKSTLPFPGVLDGLAELRRRGVALAVITNKPLDPALRILRGLGMEGCFGAILGGDSLATRKPDPGMLLEAAARLGVQWSACQVLGDSDVDMDAANAAGMPGIWCSWGGFHPDRPAQADHVVHRFDEVVARFSP